MTKQRHERTSAENAAAADELASREESLRVRLARVNAKAQEKLDRSLDASYDLGYATALEGELQLVERAREACLAVVEARQAPAAATMPAGDLPLYDRSAPWKVMLRSQTDLTTWKQTRSTFELYLRDNREDGVLLEIAPASTPTDQLGRVQLLDELLRQHGYVRVSQPRWAKETPGLPEYWSLVCDVDRAASRGVEQ